MEQKKPFFLKRWSDGLFGWIDNKLFSNSISNDAAISIAAPVWISFLIGITIGIVVAITQLFVKSADKLTNTIMTVAGIIVLIVMAFYIIKMLPDTEGTGAKIARSALIVVLGAAVFAFGAWLGVWLSILVMILLVAWVALHIIGGGSGKSSDTIRLDDGTLLTKRHDVTLNEYYTGNDGRNYTKNSDGTFSPI